MSEKMSNNPFVVAKREVAKARIGLCGPSGSGKTHSALRLAKGLAPGGKIFLIDSEQRSSCLEEGKPNIPEFMVAAVEKPYTPEKYIKLIKQACDAGADVLIIDSLSHAWSGPGGILEMVDRTKSGGNSFMAWREVTPIHNQLIDAILTADCHVIATMRTKVEWVVEKNDQGKQAPRKIGLSPVQRDGMEYEFTIVFEIDQDKHLARVSKDRTSLFDSKLADLLTEESGAMLRDWLLDGKEPEPKPEPVINAAAMNKLALLAKKAGFPGLDEACEAFAVDKNKLTLAVATDLAEKLKNTSTPVAEAA